MFKAKKNVSSKIGSTRGRDGEQRVTEDKESNCRCSEQTRVGMFPESLTLWKSLHAFTQVHSGSEGACSHFNEDKNMVLEEKKGRTCQKVFGSSQKTNPETWRLSVRTWAAANPRGPKEAQEIIRANVSFYFTAHLPFACNLHVQKSHMAVMKVYKGMML